MSFILEALKKSEAERRQGEVPSLSSEPAPAVSHRRSVWPVLLTVALLLNIAVIGGWLLLRSDKAPVAEVPVGKSDRILSAESESPAPGKHEPTPSPKKTPPAAEQETALAAAAVKSSPETFAKPAPPASTRVESSSLGPAVESPVVSQAPAAPAPKAPVVSKPPEEAGSAVPPTESAPHLAVEPAAGASAAAVESFPRLADLPSDVRSGLPELNLQLHFYSPEPARRLVRLNGFNLREGDMGGDGLNVLEITPDGIRLSCRGVRFFLPTARR